MLGFFGIGQQAVNIALEVLLISKVVAMGNSFFIGAAVRHILPIVLMLSAYSALALEVDRPSAIETPLLPPWHERLEVFNSGLQSAGAGAKKSVDVVWPFICTWIDAAEFGQDSRTENCASVGATSMTLSPERKTMNSDVAKQGNDSGYECGDYCGFYGWFPLILAWPILFAAQKPNSK